MTEKNFDLIVIGGGPGGYVAAIRAAQLGMKVAVVEAAHLGGICLNWGCIPTKALLRSAEVLTLIKHADEFGITVKGVDFDFEKIVKRSRNVASQLSKGIAHLLKKNKVTVFDGFGVLQGGGRVAVAPPLTPPQAGGDNSKESPPQAGGDNPKKPPPLAGGMGGELLRAKHIILATGARARVLPGLEPDGKLIWTYKEAMTPDILPKSILVVGSGAIGIEFASFYRALGAEVTVVEIMDRILPVEDEEISGLARKAFEKQGMKILTGAKVAKLEKSKTHVTATIETAGKTEKITAERVIMAVGIIGNTENIGLEKTKVKIDRGHIVTNEWLATDEPGIYAIGDVTGPPWLAHKASHEGVICVEKIAGVKDVHPMKKGNIPGCTYCTPQVASVGLTEKAALEQGYKIKVGRFPFIGNGKAIALGEPEGLVKTIFDETTGELLGAHMIGAEVTEMIQGFGIAKTLETTETELMHTIFPHPTLSEMMHESVLNAFAKTIHF